MASYGSKHCIRKGTTTVRETREEERSQDSGTQFLKEKSSLPSLPKDAGKVERTGEIL